MPHWIDMGPLKDFLARLKKLQKSFRKRTYRFSQSMGDFWVFEDGDDDEILGAILYVNDDRVYAISDDVHQLVTESFARESA